MTAATKVSAELLGNELLSVPQAAKLMGISDKAIKKAVARDQVKAVRIGERLMIAKAEIRRLLEVS